MGSTCEGDMQFHTSLAFLGTSVCGLMQALLAFLWAKPQQVLFAGVSGGFMVWEDGEF